EARSGRGNHLDRAARQPERQRPDGGLAGPVEHVVHRRNHEILFKPLIENAHVSPLGPLERGVYPSPPSRVKRECHFTQGSISDFTPYTSSAPTSRKARSSAALRNHRPVYDSGAGVGSGICRCAISEKPASRNNAAHSSAPSRCAGVANCLAHWW